MITLQETFLKTLKAGNACAMATVIQTKGSTPRKCGAKMLVLSDGSIHGTVGGGKFESLVIELARDAMNSNELCIKTFPLHECDDESFGAICGGEITVLVEPYAMKQRLLIAGAGHCGQALAHLALDCGWAVTIFDDRKELFETPFFRDASHHIQYITTPDALAEFPFRDDDCLVLVSRGHPEDRSALQSVLSRNPIPKLAYLGMIGSKRKVALVMKDLEASGLSAEALAQVYAPIGLDIGSESPMEIAIAIMGEILKVTRGATGGHMRT